jgi:hypothetical protein
MPFSVPQTETAPFVRPLVKSGKLERGTVSTDPELKAAEDFLRGLDDESPPEVVEQAITLLRRLRRSIPDLRIPTIAQGPDGLVGMTWENSARHVNVQVHRDHRLEFFAEDLESGALWSTEGAWNGVPEELSVHLRLAGEG